MSILAPAIFGLVTGFVASKIVSHSDWRVMMDILLGIGGAVVGSWLFAPVGMRSLSGPNLSSMLVAIVGAAVVLIVYNALVSPSGSRSAFRSPSGLLQTPGPSVPRRISDLSSIETGDSR
jgi:uncharacterized membrane protein YeaQ/YmgE (transglycosylase-associated protein family)